MSNRLKQLLRAITVQLVGLVSSAYLYSPAFAQTDTRPIYITTRIFQARVKDGTQPDLSDQVFKLTTASLNDYDKWVNGLQKAYPGAEVALLETYNHRIMRSPRGAVVTFGDAAGRKLQLMLSAATSVGDGVTPGQTIIPAVEVHFGNDMKYPPLSLAILPFEAESGKTYFFLPPTLSLGAGDYAKFIRPASPAESLNGFKYFIIFALSIELEQPPKAPRAFDDKQSVALQAEATRKVEPEIPDKVRQTKLAGKVRVSVEISPEGRVTTANVVSSSVPELNKEVIAAARQWEFSKSLFAENKQPITGLLGFSVDTSAAPARQ
jgi:TonB family protein